ncbi:hypothetical protein [Flavobacterium sp.]|uniref:hypothetical protein n=1 Tax=Flavobacterium sp. TaxID=239 RepID=UPI0022CA89B1|nr:hypothetical protein [Flavobacterium sp.]MCZ8229975.1 hypothetical protein [Flavobacterium sp.]
MKKIILIKMLIVVIISTMQAQEKPKDTLFFALEKNYTISPTLIPNMGRLRNPDLIPATEDELKNTNTLGYIYFIGNGYLNTGLKPKKILSIKDYIENKKFYMEGKYNNVVDIYKLNDSLFGKYTILFVNGKEFIEPRHIEYKKYHTNRDTLGNRIPHPLTKKDTLFFNFDEKYIIPSKHDKGKYSLNGENCLGGTAFSFDLEFKEFKESFKPEIILDLKKYIHTSRFYDSKNKSPECFSLAYFMDNYVLIFVQKKDGKVAFLKTKVEAYHTIED